ncbi:MAG: IS256 family transposase [Actinomycetota bacterium]
MAKSSMDITSFAGKLLEEEDVDLLREGVRVLAQMLMETEVSNQIGAAPYERTENRTAYRNGYRSRSWDTRVGTVELKIPKVTAGTYFPSLLEPRRRAEKALHAVVCEAYIKGVSTRKVDDLVRALGIDGISKSQVSRICKALDAEVEAFRTRPIDGEFPYVWLDATYHKVREAGQVVSVANVVAIGCNAEGERRVLGTDCGAAEDEAFWTAFLRSLLKRGLKGVRLVISDSHVGLKAAAAKVLSGAAWQRCRVHFMRNLLALVPKAAQDAVGALVRTIFYQADHAAAMAHLREVAEMLQPRFPEAAALLEEAAEDVLAHLHFPKEHRRRLHSTNVVERLHLELKRRTRVVGIFPNRASLLRMVGTLLLEQDDEWQVMDRRYFSAESMAKIGTEIEGGELTKELVAAIA